MEEKYMREALRYAALAAKDEETPIGAVIVRGGEIVSFGRNRREKHKNALGHAEIEAINKACKKLGGWRLPGCEMYVTLEPCPMCAGAIVASRIEKVYIGAKDEKSGAFGSCFDLNSFPLNHKPEIHFGLLEEESKALLKSFFRELRKSKKKG